MMARTLHPVPAMPDEAPQAKRSSQNSRRDRRRPPRGSLKVVCRKGKLGLGANIALSLLDISTGGVRLLVKEALKRGDELEIELDAPWIQKPVKLAASVAWYAPIESGHSVGVTFNKLLPFAELQNLSRP